MLVEGKMDAVEIADLLEESHLLELLNRFGPLLPLDLPSFDDLDDEVKLELCRELEKRGASRKAAEKAAAIATRLISSSPRFSIWVPMVNLNGEGELFRMDVLVRPTGGEGVLEWSKGIRDDGFRSSIEMAHKLACSEIGENYDVYLSMAGIPYGAQIHGASAGLSVAIAIEAAAMGQRIGLKSPGDLAVTGALDSMGRVLPVSDIPAKIRAVLHRINEGYRINAIVVPMKNLDEARKHCRDEVQIIGFDSLSDAISVLLDPWSDYLSSLSSYSSSQTPVLLSLKRAIEDGKRVIYLDKVDADREHTLLQIAAFLAEERLSFFHSDGRALSDLLPPPVPIPVLKDEWRDKLELVEEAISQFGTSVSSSLILSELNRDRFLFISSRFHPDHHIWVLTEAEWRREKGRISAKSSVISHLKTRSTCFDEHIRHVWRVVIPGKILACRDEGISFEDFLRSNYMRLKIIPADDPKGTPVIVEEAIIENRRMLILGEGGTGKSAELLRLFALASRGELKVDLNGEEIQLVPVYLTGDDILRQEGDIEKALKHIIGKENMSELAYTPGVLLLLDELDKIAHKLNEVLAPLESPPYENWLCLGAMRLYEWFASVEVLPPIWKIYQLLPPSKEEVKRFLGFNPGGVNLPLLLHLMRRWIISNGGVISHSRRSDIYRSAFQNWTNYELPNLEGNLTKVGITSNNLSLMIRRTLEELAIHCLEAKRSNLSLSEACQTIERWIVREIKPKGYFPSWWAHERAFTLRGESVLIPIGRFDHDDKPDEESILFYLEAISSLPFFHSKNGRLEFSHDEIRDYWAAEGLARRWNRDRMIPNDLIKRISAKNAIVMASGFADDPEEFVRNLFDPSDLYRAALATEALLECDVPSDLKGEIITTVIDHLIGERFEIQVEGLRVLNSAISGDVVLSVLRHLNEKEALPLFLELGLIRVILERFAASSDRDKNAYLDWLLPLLFRLISKVDYLSNRKPLDRLKSEALKYMFDVLGSSSRDNPVIREKIAAYLRPLMESDSDAVRARGIGVIGQIFGDKGIEYLKEIARRDVLSIELRWSALAKLCGVFRDEEVIPYIQSLLEALAEGPCKAFRYSNRYGTPERTSRLIRRWALHDLVFFFGYREEVIQFVDEYREFLSPEEMCELIRAFIRSGWGIKTLKEWIRADRFPTEATPILISELGYPWRMRTLSEDTIRRIAELVEMCPEANTPFERWIDILNRNAEMPPNWGGKSIDPEEFYRDFTEHHRFEDGKRWWLDGFRMILALREGEPMLQQRVLDLLGSVACDSRKELNERLINMTAVADIGRTLPEWGRPVLHFLTDMVALDRDPIVKVWALKLMSLIPEIIGYVPARRMIERTIEGNDYHRQISILPGALISCGPHLLRPIYKLYRRARSTELRRRITYALSAFWEPEVKGRDQGANDQVCDMLIEIAGGDPDPLVRLEAIYSFARIAPTNRMGELKMICGDNSMTPAGTVSEIARRLMERWF
jgi:hypothetical protein